MHVHFAVINKLDQRLQVIENDVLQYDYWVFARRALRRQKNNRRRRLDEHVIVILRAHAYVHTYVYVYIY